ncbi:MAG: Uncharacterised protein [Synechococcus sp. CC9902]|nr:MAG: Uncharacterised protein [Synechococcus sp. CC9902]
MTDAKAVELAIPGLLFRTAQGQHQIGGRFFAHPLKTGKQGCIQAVEIGQRAHQAPFHQLFDQLAAEAVHIESSLAHPVTQAAAQDRWAAAVHTAGCHLIAFAHENTAAFGALIRKLHHVGVAGSELRQHANHLRDDFACLAHHDGVAQMQIQLNDPVGVVEGGAADAGAGQSHGFELRHRRDRTGAAHLNADPYQTCWGFFGWVFEGDRPAWRLLSESGFILKTQIVQLHHHAIGGVREVMALLFPAIAEVLDRHQVRSELTVRVDPEPCLLKPLQDSPLAAGLLAGGARQMQGVGEEVEPACRHHLRVQLSQGSSAGVAGVGEESLTATFTLGVDRCKGGVGNERLPADFHPGRGIVDLQTQRDRIDRPHIGCDLLTAAAVASGCSTVQHPVSVTEGQGIAVDLQLTHQG